MSLHLLVWTVPNTRAYDYNSTTLELVIEKDLVLGKHKRTQLKTLYRIIYLIYPKLVVHACYDLKLRVKQ